MKGGDNQPNNRALDEWLARRVVAGWKPKAIVAAADGRISERTVYRWKREVVRLEDVHIGGHAATFVIRRTMAPLRVTDWRPA